MVPVPAVEAFSGLRVVASSAALDDAAWPAGATVLRLAADEALVLGANRVDVADPHALVELETGLCGAEMERWVLEEWLEREAEWPAPDRGLGQGMAAGLPVKVWMGDERALVLTRGSLAAELEERL